MLLTVYTYFNILITHIIHTHIGICFFKEEHHTFSFYIMAQRGQNQQAQAQVQALAHPVTVPKSYSAKLDEDWVSWLAGFNAACVVNGYGDYERIRFMAALLEGTARQMFTTTRAANQNATYTQLCTLLGAQFEPPEQQLLHESQLRARVKQPNETQAAFASALRSLAERAFPGQGLGGVVDRIVLQQFIDGQSTPELRLQLATNRPAGLDEAVQRAISITTAYQMEATRSGTSAVVAATVAPPNPPQASNSELVALLQSINQKLDSLAISQQASKSSSGPKRDNVRPRTCYTCGEPGHFARNCPRANGQSGN